MKKKPSKKMIKELEQKPEPVPAPAERSAEVVRRLAAAFRQIDEFEPFVRGLEAALGQAEFFDRAALNLYPGLGRNGEESDVHFPAATLCLPLSGRKQVHGMAEFSNDRRKFGPGDLHLMAGLADFVSVLMDHALHFGEQRKNFAMLTFLLNQMPVGVVCCDKQGEILLSNPLGQRMMGVALDGRARTLPEDWLRATTEAACGPDGAGEFHRRMDGQLLQVQVKAAGSATGAEKDVTALVLTDLAPERDKFHEVLARESYRCGWLGRPISLALVSASSSGDLMAILRPLRERLGLAALVGPCDVDAVGILFPEMPFAEALGKMRMVRSLLENDWQVGVATGEQTQGDPEGLVAEAEAARARVGDFLQHRLLLHDDYESVNDMLELMLKDDFQVMKSSNIDQTIRQLRRGCYDGFFSEIDLSHGSSVVELTRVAREVNPKIKPFFTSCAADSRRDEPGFQHEIIFRKPFDVREVVSTVKETFHAS